MYQKGEMKPICQYTCYSYTLLTKFYLLQYVGIQPMADHVDLYTSNML